MVILAIFVGFYVLFYFTYTSFLTCSSPFMLLPTDGQLRHTKTGEPFVFNEREDLHRWNQKRYEALGEVTQNAGQPRSANLVSSTGFIGLICPE